MDNNTIDAKQDEYEIYVFTGNNILRETTSDIIKYFNKKEHKKHKKHNISLVDKLIYIIVLVILVSVIYNFLFF